MSKYLKLFVKYFLLALAALIITWFTQFAALYGHPTISQPSIYCNTSSNYIMTLPPSHDSGLLIPYITHYISDGGCGVGTPITLYLFVIDCLIWFLVVVGAIRLIKYLAKK
jgi:hypothetical protein